ncbi:MAG: HAD family hydrolase [Candidatus Aenigmarchaeota archaeon]|nr:HAD family hydrolase [Candidatus Aenigmarchaeota archaeon]
MIKAVVFDFDDTLVRTFDSCIGAMRQVSERLGLHVPDRPTIVRNWGKSVRDCMSALWPGEDIDQLNEVRLSFQPSIPFSPVTGAHETIDLMSKRYVLGIVSGEQREALVRKAVQAKIDLKKFDFVITASDTGVPKTDPRYFDLARQRLERLGVGIGEVLFVGDSIHDYRVSRSAGVHFAGVLTGPATREDLVASGMNDRMIIPSVTDLPRFIRANGFT